MQLRRRKSTGRDSSMEKVVSNEYPKISSEQNNINNKAGGEYSEFKRFIKSNKIPEYAREYIEYRIKELSNNYEENCVEIIIYKYILNLVGFISNYINNPTKDNLKIVDWYFIDLIINKDKIIVRGLFYELGFYIKDEIVSEGLLELESMINKMNE